MIWDEHYNQVESEKDSGPAEMLPDKKCASQDDADQDDDDHCDAIEGTTTNNQKVVYSRTDQNEDIVMDISNHDITTTSNRNVMSNFKIDRDHDGYKDSKPKKDRKRGRRQQNKEYVKDLSHIPFQSIDPAHYARIAFVETLR